MFEYTYQNHFKFGYRSDSGPCTWYGNRSSSDQDFFAEYGSVQRPNLTWTESNALAAQMIYETKSASLVLLLSGGTDSEVCAHAFLKQGIPFQAATLRLSQNRNFHDIKYAIDFCSHFQIPHRLIDVDLESLWSDSVLWQVTDPIQCVSPIIAAQLWLADQIDGQPIIAQGEVHLKKRLPADYVPGVSEYLPSPWDLVESERLCSIYKHFILQGRPAIPGFFQYLPEQIYSYLTRNPYLDDLVQNRVIGKLGTRTSKNKIIRQFYPEIPEREKFHGFEQVMELHDPLRAKLAQRYPHSDQNYYMSLEPLLKSLNQNFIELK